MSTAYEPAMHAPAAFYRLPLFLPTFGLVQRENAPSLHLRRASPILFLVSRKQLTMASFFLRALRLVVASRRGPRRRVGLRTTSNRRRHSGCVRYEAKETLKSNTKTSDLHPNFSGGDQSCWILAKPLFWVIITSYSCCIGAGQPMK